MKNMFLLLFAGLIIIFFSSCSKDASPTEPKQDTEVIVTETAVPLDAEIRDNITLEDTNFTFKLPQSLIASKKIAVDDILVESATANFPYGFLRKITSITVEGDQSKITTSQAVLKDVIEKGSISIKKAELGKNNLVSIKLIEGAKLTESNSLEKSNMIGINWSYQKDIYSSGSDKIEMSGNFEFKLGLNFDLQIDFFDVEYFKTSVEVEQSVSLAFKSKLTKDISEKRIPFAKAVFTPITFSIGIVPVVIVPEVTLYLGVDGQISAETETWCRESFSGEYGLKYSEDSGWDLINSDNFSLEKELPAINGVGNFRAFAGPKASMKLYGIAGPYVTLDAFATLESKMMDARLNYDFAIGFECNAGVEIEIFGWNALSTYKNVFSKELFNFNNNTGEVTNSFKVTNPIEGASFLIGDFIKTTTFYSGNNPNEVKFYFDDNLMNTDVIEPFEYEFSTANYNAGSHKIKAVAAYADQTLESEINISIINAGWEKLDISNLISASDIIHRVYFVNENLGFVTGGGLKSSFILKTTNGGTSWQKVLGINEIGDREIKDIVYINSGEMYAISETAMFFSGDNGSTWISFQPEGEQIYSLVGGTKFALSSEGLIIAGYSSFYLKVAESTGNVWKEITELNDMYHGEAKAIKYLSNKRIIALNSKTSDANKSNILISDDGGYNWHAKDLGIPSNWLPEDMDFTDDKNGWIVGSDDGANGFILRTSDGGNSWTISTNANDGVFVGLHSIDFYDYQNGIVSGVLIDSDLMHKHQGILSSNNGGNSWNNTSLTNYPSYGEIRTLFMLNKTSGWAAGTDKMLYKFGSK